MHGLEEWLAVCFAIGVGVVALVVLTIVVITKLRNMEAELSAQRRDQERASADIHALRARLVELERTIASHGASGGPEAASSVASARRGPGASISPAMPAKRSRTDVRFRLRITHGDTIAVGPGKIDLLEAIDGAGSLTAAAKRLGMSYRRAWLFVQQINKTFDQQAISTPEHGHGGEPARLTDFGRELIKRYRELEALTDRAAAPTLDWLSRHAGRTS